ncbi:MAG: cytochrome P460 family protein [Bacteriovorax sp.]|jgi:hypothetical protein
MSILLIFPFMIFNLFAMPFPPSDSMNGISYAKYKNFDKKWKLITVRYRKDTEEMRFTYANAIAYRALKSNSSYFPEGAVLGKVGVKTSPDPLFESSVVPGGVRRYQLMVKDRKYKNEHGWGYALFDENGLTFPEDLQNQVKSCSACHEIAESRGFVFSQLPGNLNARTAPLPQAMNFLKMERKLLPTNVQNHIPESFNYIKILKSNLDKNIFQGTLEEIRPTLSLEVYKSKLPAVVISDHQHMFSAVLPENLPATCQDGPKKGIYMKSIYSRINSMNEVQTLHYCFSH